MGLSYMPSMKPCVFVVHEFISPSAKCLILNSKVLHSYSSPARHEHAAMSVISLVRVQKVSFRRTTQMRALAINPLERERCVWK
jgi:hypothetical protein